GRGNPPAILRLEPMSVAPAGRDAQSQQGPQRRPASWITRAGSAATSGRGVILSRPMALVLPVVFAFVGRGPRCPPAAAPRPERRPPRAQEEKAPTAVPSRLFAKTKIPATSYSPTRSP